MVIVMAASVLIGDQACHSGNVSAGVEEALYILSDTIKHVIAKTCQFEPKLKKIQETINIITPIFNEIEKPDNILDRPKAETDFFIDLLKQAEVLVRECKRIRYWDYNEIYKYSLKLDELDESLIRFFQINVQLQQTRDIKEMLVVVKDVSKRMNRERSSGSWLSRAPPLDGFVIGFDDRVKDLKKMVLKDSRIDDCSVVAVSAGGGSGKTTLVTMLCQDQEIKGKFGENIYFATISETPNLKIIIKDLLKNKQGGQQLEFVNDDDAIRKWGSFLGEDKSEKLLVLDDVWSESIIWHFKFKLRGYTILVTSRSTFTQFNTYQLELLNHEDSTKLFRHSAISESGSEHNVYIPDGLVDEMVTCCKNHPLTLSVIGDLLKGKNVATWHRMLKNLSEGKQTVFELADPMLTRLLRSFNVFEEKSEIKQCYLDLGLFPEDQKIAATLLMDLWVHLLKHDKGGSDTINQLYQLSYKNLATLLPIRKDSPMISNWCEEITVKQHDLLRTLAIYLSSQEPEKDRERLIIKPDGPYPPEVPQSVNARILSISTDEKFSEKWNDMQASKVEVLVMNFMSKMHPLPQFIQYIQKLKVLIITNYGYYFSDLENFPPPQYLSSLTTIRLDHVSVSSICTSLLELKNLQKLSLIVCKIGNSFNECSTDGIPNKLPSLMELVIDSCDDLITFPVMLCFLFLLEKLSITNCHKLTSLSEEFGNLRNVDVLRLASCSNLTTLPKSIGNLKKLSIIDMRGCTGLHELPSSVKGPLEVVCDKETSLLWNHVPEVKIHEVEEDKVGTFMRIV